jgi:putative transposase
MSVFSLTVGLIVRHGERTWHLERHLDDGRLIFVDPLTGAPKVMTVKSFWDSLQSKKLTVVTGVRIAPGEQVKSTADLVFTWDSVKHKHQVEVERRLGYIKLVSIKGHSRGMREGIKELIKSSELAKKDEHPPSSSTVMRWMRQFEAGEKSPASLLPKHAFHARKRRKDEKVLAIARKFLRNVYCKTDKPSLESTRLQIDRQLGVEVEAKRIAPEDAKLSASTLLRLKNEIDPYALDRARHGSNFTRHKWRYSLSGPEAERALSRYEVDHTIVDVVCVCDRTGLPLGRPTITAVVDSFSGYVVGIFISFWGTGLAATFRALQVAFSPKDDFNAILGSDQPWLGMGLPELLALDNGLEFHSPQFRLMAMQLCIDLFYCAVRQPWLKPFVERALGAYLNQLPSHGRVRKAMTNDLPGKPDKTAAVPFSDLCNGILKSFVQVHAYEINERKLARPVDLFGESFESLPPPMLPVSTEELNIIVAPSKILTVGNEGVGTQYQRYNSPELQDLRRKTALSYKALIKFNPEDMGHVFVQDVISKGWLRVPNCNQEYSNGLSMVQHRAIRALAQDRLNRKNADKVLAAAKLDLIDMWASRARAGQRMKAAHLKALSRMTSNDAVLGKTGPDTAKTPSKLICPEEMVPPDTDIPTFSGFAVH